ncbi:MAG TPA: tyrosine-type recombinase/integrase [Ktedonobacteraceae bacterium]|nr:tyrosine-type recombinase/integrase [Ktedonobacteraceae bacterium]
MDLVFCNRHGGYLHSSHMLATFHKLVEDAGLPQIRFHDLRHSATPILLVKGVHPKVVQELLGHSSIVMTMDTYSHALPSMQRDAMNTMNEIFKRQ